VQLRRQEGVTIIPTLLLKQSVRAQDEWQDEWKTEKSRSKEQKKSNKERLRERAEAAIAKSELLKADKLFNKNKGNSYRSHCSLNASLSS
jgi:hypothetical protein